MMTKNCTVVMPEKEIKEHKEFVIYNYLATMEKKITEDARCSPFVRSLSSPAERRTA